MILIYWKWKVWTAIAKLCEAVDKKYEIKDDKDSLDDFWKYEYIIPSPWIPPTHKIYSTWKILGELDFAYSQLPSWFKVLSVTWTDWKSTTSWMLYNILLKEFGNDKVFLSWNFDIPFSQTVADILNNWLKKWYIVVEISSFMAYNINTFKSDYSIFTNFDSDHLNWHEGIDDYFNSKVKLINNTIFKCAMNISVLESKERLLIKNSLNDLAGKIRYFGISNSKELKDRVELPYIIISWRKKYDIRETNFSWWFNAENLLSASIITNELWICSKRTKRYLQEIKWLPHRIELYKEKSWIRYIDDSKSTSCQALKAALSSFENNIILIAWWIDKWDTFFWLEECIRWKVRFASLIWQTKVFLSKKFESENIDYKICHDMDEAVREAINNAKVWDIVLLSPWCASLDMFSSYEDRANKFKESVDKYA